MYKQLASKFVGGVIVVDWSKGPSDAQYYSPETDENYEGFVKIVDGCVFFTSNESHGLNVWVQDWYSTVGEVINDKELIKKEVKNG